MATLLAPPGALASPQPLPGVEAPPVAQVTRRMFVRLDSKGDAPPVVSYKKLCREYEDAARGTGSGDKARAAAAPQGAGAEVEQPEDGAAQSDEGESSDDEEDDDSPEGDADSSQGDDDDEEGSRSSGRDAGDWYDVDDGFIDDSEFLDAADVDERKPKHNGFFMNKGEIECEPGVPRELPHASPAKKRMKLSIGGDGPAKSLKLATVTGATGIDGSPSLVVAGNLGGAGGGVDQHRLSVGKGKGKPFDAAFLTAGPLADAISELRAVVAQAPPPPADQKRKCMTPAMLEGLDKIKALIAVYAELPRGLTTKLLEFMDPFAGVSTLRRRLGQDRDEDAPAAAALPPAAAVLAVAAPAAALEQAAGVAAAPKRPAPTPAQVDAGIAKLRTCVQARCDVLQSAAAAGAAGGEQPASAGAEDQDVSFKWDRECEEALHTVVLNRIAVGTGKHKSAFKDVLELEIWPAGLVDEKALKLAHTRVMKRRERAAGVSGGAKRQAGEAL